MWSAITRRLGEARSVGAGLARRGLDERLEEIDLVVRVHVLEHGGEALQAHARIHRGLGERVHRARLVAVELHEHEVPDLDVAVAVRIGEPGGPPSTSGPWS
jgi:hypothetical protein